MQVSLKQSELTAAVRQFIASKGISLAGKEVDVKFSATRGDAGIMATIDIEDIDMPDLTPNMPAQLRVVAAPTALASIATTPVLPEPFAIAGTVADENKVEAGFAAVGGVTVDEEPAKKTSLFN